MIIMVGSMLLILMTTTPPDSRRQSTESIPYGKAQPPQTEQPESQPEEKPAEQETETQTETEQQPQTEEEQQKTEEQEEGDNTTTSPPPAVTPQPQRLEHPHFHCTESGLEMGALYNLVYPQLRSYCAFRGYELRVVDPHWGSGDCVEDISQLCLTTLANLRGTRLLGLVREPDFESEIKALVTAEAKNCLWLQRRMTHLPPGTLPRGGPCQGGLERSKALLVERLPESQKLMFHCKWHPDGLHLPEHKPYLQEICESIREELCKIVEHMMDDNSRQELQLPFPGIERTLHLELCQQANHILQLTQDSIDRQELEFAVKEYLEKETGVPLIIHGVSGCGKTVFMARLAKLLSQWYPTAAVVCRIVGSTPDSADLNRLLLSIGEQCCALFKRHASFAFQQTKEEPLRQLLEKVPRPIVILVDGLDQLGSRGLDLVSWVPVELPANVYLVLSATTGSSQFEKLKNVIPDESCYLEIPSEDADLCWRIFSRCLDKINSPLNNSARDRFRGCLTLPRAAELSSYIRYPSHFPPTTNKISQEEAMEILIECVKTASSPTIAYFILELFLNSQAGLSESELIEMLSTWKGNMYATTNTCPYAIWSLFILWMQPFFKQRIVGNQILMFWRSNAYKEFISEYVKDNCGKSSAREVFVTYFRGMPFANGNHPNRRKLDEVILRRSEIFDCDWIEAKLKGTDPFVLLDNIQMLDGGEKDPELMLLYDFIRASAYALRYDGSQFYTHAYARLKNVSEKYPSLLKIFQRASKPPVSSLLALSSCLREMIPSTPDTPDPEPPCPYTYVFPVPRKPSLMLALSPAGERLVLWDIYNQIPIRTLVGLEQPRDLRTVADTLVLVLCNRELRFFNLDNGDLIIKLKGVMNQKMAYFGIHGSHYVVALSRNRMYVNMFNLNTGELETTFKVGEDRNLLKVIDICFCYFRFLNSLLVSANGKICVCGDETQKPFPLLVWNLDSRKLVHDLRIPHHEFLTKLAAISDDGHYVACICREINEDAPSFIVVYELESGTLFKKWKPEAHSCSIAISSQGSCVINGLFNAWLMVWDLSTGTRRFTFQGHCAPVDQIQIDEPGNRCATFDSAGRDRSVRVWDLNRGECVCVFTPDVPLLCCQLAVDGRSLVVSLEGNNELITMIICKNSSPEDLHSPIASYGDPSRRGLVIEVNDDG
ncbi:hypothetical protein LAZ67_X004724 [Cordylochernes scorpioides]|uniref:NACHT domain-containing protein n=1 Tax=Cordylochernes scorpioides TaxID=51811 RepID=A0ABY6LVL9_9ARAC|nr:hypothetical protein LAZ67_X004724 [Cordylochernes scorpioides]